MGIRGRLGHHLDWFLWDEQTRGSDIDRADTLSGQAVTGEATITHSSPSQGSRSRLGPTGGEAGHVNGGLIGNYVKKNRHSVSC